MVIEMRDNAYNKAFELLDEALNHHKETKMVLCALEDAMYDCYNVEHQDEDKYDDEQEEYNDDEDMNFRRGMRSSGRRMRYNDGSYRSYRNMRSQNRMRRY